MQACWTQAAPLTIVGTHAVFVNALPQSAEGGEGGARRALQHSRKARVPRCTRTKPATAGRPRKTVLLGSPSPKSGPARPAPEYGPATHSAGDT
eukprot:365891-Chlamydomonas_euryale.AAC.9